VEKSADLIRGTAERLGAERGTVSSEPVREEDPEAQSGPLQRLVPD
jgi:hypothetical protein